MDYGQTPQTDLNQPFFPEAIDENAPENNLDLSNASVPWRNGEAAPTRGQNQNFGKNAINGQLVENPNQPVEFEFAPTPGIAPDFGPTPEMLGQITNTEPAAPEKPATDLSFDQSAIRFSGDSLDKEAVGVIGKMKKELDSTGDAAKFVEEFTAAKAALKNNSSPGES